MSNLPETRNPKEKLRFIESSALRKGKLENAEEGRVWGRLKCPILGQGPVGPVRPAFLRWASTKQ